MRCPWTLPLLRYGHQKQLRNSASLLLFSDLQQLVYFKGRAEVFRPLKHNRFKQYFFSQQLISDSNLIFNYIFKKGHHSSQPHIYTLTCFTFKVIQSCSMEYSTAHRSVRTPHHSLSNAISFITSVFGLISSSGPTHFDKTGLVTSKTRRLQFDRVH